MMKSMFGDVIKNYLLDQNIAKSKQICWTCKRNSRYITFVIDNVKYNLYVKYSKKFEPDRKGNKKCSFQFTDKELDSIKEYALRSNNTYVALICTDQKLSKTEIIFIWVDDVLKILGSDYINIKKNMYVKHIKRDRHFNVWGTMLDEINALPIRKGFNKIYKKDSQKMIA